MKLSDNYTNRSIVYLGESGFPYGFAPIQRQLLISKGLVEAGANVTVVSAKGIFDPNREIDLTPTGSYQGVNYVYTAGEIHRRPNFMGRNLMKVKGLIGEIVFLARRRREIKTAIVATMRFQSILYYFLISRLLGFRILLNYVEKNRFIPTRSGFRDRLNDLFLDIWALRCADGILPISHYLSQEVADNRPSKPYLRIPVISDFSESEMIETGAENERYFLYCGTATYIELIEFVLSAFSDLDRDDIYLYLVVGGDDRDMQRFHQRVESSPKRDRIKCFTRVPYSELLQMYHQAIGLLIPLRPTIQDKARFPHKIGEYLASGAPIITTSYGEVKHYFTDRVDALIANEYNTGLFAEKMNYVIENPEEAKRIGKNGRILGVKEFDYRKHGKNLLKFIKVLNQ